MNKTGALVTIAAILLLSIVALYLFLGGEQVAMIEESPEISSSAIGQSEVTPSEPVPIVRHRIPQESVEEKIEVVPAPPPKPLPTLTDSDPVFAEELAAIAGESPVKKLLVLKSVLSRFVVTTENLATRSLPLKHMASKPVKGSFKVKQLEPGVYQMDPRNYERYQPYVAMLESTDIDKLVALYVRYYPLLQESFEMLGYPDLYFNDRFIATIDHLLETPDLTESPKLILPSVMFRYADSELEKLSAGQKALLRMGPDNAARVKQRLRLIRQSLTGFGTAG